MVLRGVLLTTVLLIFLPGFLPGVAAGQRTVKLSDAWVSAAVKGDTLAYLVVENGTMYDVYITGAETDDAEAVELIQTAGGKSRVAKEVAVAAFDRLAMSPDGIHLRVKGLRRSLGPGDTVALILTLDSGDRVTATATVK